MPDMMKPYQAYLMIGLNRVEQPIITEYKNARILMNSYVYVLIFSQSGYLDSTPSCEGDCVLGVVAPR